MCKLKRTFVAPLLASTLTVLTMPIAAQEAPAPQSSAVQGLAAQFPGDVGIERHRAVLFVEDFEADSLETVVSRWNWSRGDDNQRLRLDSQVDAPPGSGGRQSLKMTIRRGEQGDSADLRKILARYHPQIYLRFYVRFAEDYGFHHHFTRIRGERNPTPYHAGGAGRRPESSFSAAIETDINNMNHFPVRERTAPPGFWRFYVYWPEMRSWQTVEGVPDGRRSNPYYGNLFTPLRPVAVKRGEWQCVEIMVRMNSAPGAADGALGLWIDGVPAGLWDPQAQPPVRGYWMRDVFRWDPEHPQAASFTGFNWTPLDAASLQEFKNVIHLHHYVSSDTWRRADRYAAQNAEHPINLTEATVWKDHVVVATEYIGPIKPIERRSDKLPAN